MKNTQHKIFIFFFVLLSLTLSHNLSGQLLINMDNSVVNQGETVCVDLVAEDFDLLIGVTFAIQWDSTILEFVEMTNLSSIFAINDFGTTKVNEGRLSFQWFDVGAGKSLPDGQILFSVCFKAIGEQGAESKIRIVETDGDPGIEVLNQAGQNIFLSAADALINITFETIPDNAVIIYYDDLYISEGENFCVPIRVKNFTAMDDLQFSMEFNTTRFQYDRISFKEEKGSDWFLNIFVNPDKKIQYLGFNQTSKPGLSIDDEDRLFEICFTHLLSESCVFDELLISSNPLAIDASQYNPDGSVRVPVIYQPGKIRLANPIIYNRSNISPVTCSEPDIGSISVDATGGTDGIKYLWSNGETTSSISNLSTGRYDVSISDICLAVDTIFRSFEVALLGDMPTADAGDDIEFDCNVETVFLDGSGSSAGPAIAYSWRSIDGHPIVAGASSVRPEVDNAGEYEMVVMDVSSGCTTIDTVEVIDLRLIPDIMAGDDVMLQCDDVSILLTGTGTIGVNLQHEWSTTDGNIIRQVGRSGIDIDRPGTYTFKITDSLTGCSAEDELVVGGDNVIPEVGITGMTSLSCSNSQISLGAFNVEESGISYAWSTMDGSIVSDPDEFNIVVDAPGRYRVTAQRISGCSATDEIIIIDQRTMPSALAGNDAMISCDDDDITLIGSGSMGAQYQYNWSTSDGNIVSQTPEGTAVINSAGTYTFTVLETTNGCSTSDDVIVTGSNDRPQASISGSGSTVLNCSISSLQLNANNVEESGVSYAWSTMDGSIVSDPDEFNVVVDAPGRYQVTAQSISGCSVTDEITIIDERTMPSALAGNDAMISCDDDDITIIGSGSMGAQYQYNWTTPDGNIVSQTPEGTAVINSAGTYTFTVLETANGCSTSDDVIVTGNNDRPQASISGSGSTVLNCSTSSLQLNANNVEESGVSYVWSTMDGSIVSDPDEFNVVVDAPGTYQVTAQRISGCSVTDEITIIDERTMPSALAGNDAMISCDDDDITLNGSGSMGIQYQYSWTTSDGSIVSQTPEGTAVINSAGTYTFTVLETNGCSTSDDVIVTGNNDRPQASISVSGSTVLNCVTSSLQLNANNGAGGVAGLSYAWSSTDGSIIDGSAAVLATIDQPGTYSVRVTNDVSGCSDNSTVTITSAIEEPMISVIPDVTVDCSTEPKTLTATSDNMSNMNFQWNLVEGNGQILSESTNAEVEVMGIGKYEVVVTNPMNGCSSRDTTTLSLSAALTQAQLGMDFDHCESETTLMGNLQGDITGLWTVIAGSAVLEEPTNTNCGVNSLSEGINTFVWSLSSSGCPDYSSDTININFITAPIAVDDNYEVTQGFGALDLNLLANDQYPAESGAMINLTSQPSQGLLLERGIGEFTYTLDDPNVFGTFTFEYELCDELCSLNCDIATVTINVRESNIPPDIETSNDPQSLGITPNGDGLNDQLIFDELISNGDKYATKRLIVYNRWGDIVHEAQPYNNDWGGTNKKGGLLPQGTYYFIMQLDLGQGSIIEGDVTILQ